MFELCLTLLKDVVDVLIKKKEMKNETKFRVSILLEEISKVLQDTADSLSKDIYPQFNCSLMEKMVNHLHFYLIDFVPNEQLDSLHNLLKECSQVEKQFSIRKEQNTIPSLYNAAAEFKAISLLLKI